MCGEGQRGGATAARQLGAAGRRGEQPAVRQQAGPAPATPAIQACVAWRGCRPASQRRQHARPGVAATPHRTCRRLPGPSQVARRPPLAPQCPAGTPQRLPACLPPARCCPPWLSRHPARRGRRPAALPRALWLWPCPAPCPCGQAGRHRQAQAGLAGREARETGAEDSGPSQRGRVPKRPTPPSAALMRLLPRPPRPPRPPKRAEGVQHCFRAAAGRARRRVGKAQEVAGRGGQPKDGQDAGDVGGGAAQQEGLGDGACGGANGRPEGGRSG